jgi:hypothetical protein
MRFFIGNMSDYSCQQGDQLQMYRIGFIFFIGDFRDFYISTISERVWDPPSFLSTWYDGPSFNDEVA